MKEKFLGEFEQMVMLAILKLNDNAYGVSIRDMLIEAIDRDVSVGALYTTLERLEKKGLLTSSQGEAIAERGGRAKKFYAVTGQGKQALNRAKNALDTLWQGVQLSKLARYA
ncbi:MAG: PadR family transcriptional regulator [Pseudoalteromonas spongiae]|uniref:Helix-turn-helix transcriptional regulator n=1 Tax=Pseudoalteromonas spongiae TaxID=298657 RepID=A0ABU8ESG4_9GAMM|nr:MULTISPECIES: helix-turn-helix transcriptional regulator [Pseudoalteromonas]KPV94960.1 Transcriptional regulator PadR-like family protein [Pseudoalteromonas sp. P1-9]